MGDEPKKSVRLEVPESMHSDWKDFVDESGEYSSLSGLIRSSVTRRIKEVRSDRDRRAETVDVDVDLSNVEDSIFQIENRLSTIESEIQQLDLASTDISTELMHKIRYEIPVVGSADELHGDAGTIESLADVMDFDQYDIERALAKLEREAGIVESEVREDGTRVYYEVS